MGMSWGKHISQFSWNSPSLFLSSQQNTNSTSFHFQNCLYLESRLYGYSKTIFQRQLFFKEIFVIMLAICLNPNFFFTTLQSKIGRVQIFLE